MPFDPFRQQQIAKENAMNNSRQRSLPQQVGSGIANALLGLRQALPGIQQASQLGDPLTAALAGAAGAVGAPTIEEINAKKQAEAEQLRLQQLSMTPIGQAAPELLDSLQKMGLDVSADSPLAAIQQFSPAISAYTGMVNI